MVAESSIEEKKQKRGDNAKAADNWAAFSWGVFYSLVTAALWLLFGSGFVALVHSKNLDDIFPTDGKKPPYAKPMGAYAPSPLDLFAANKYSAPYDVGSKEGIMGDIKVWIADSIKFSYTNGRDAIKSVLGMLAAVDNKFSTKSFSFWLYGLTAALLISLSQIYGFLSTFVGQFVANWKWGLLFLFVFGIDFFIAGAVTGIQFLQTLITFTVLPLGMRLPGIGSIMKRHVGSAVAILGIGAALSAAGALTGVWSTTMVIVGIVMVLFGGWHVRQVGKKMGRITPAP